jgi:5-methylcytosine-specific restriction endonuclease McrA
MIRQCETCGTEFNGRRFCSKSCSRNRIGGMTPRKRVNYSSQLVCVHCGSNFEALTGLKVKMRKFCSKSCAAKSRDHSYMKSEAYHLASVRNPNLSAYKQYRGKVHRLTKQTYKLHKEAINPFDFPRTLCGVVGGYQLDHIVSIKYGFENNIEPMELACRENLQMLPWRVNLLKGRL